MTEMSLATIAEAYRQQTDAAEEARYFEAIGRFIVAYAAVESIIHQLARKLSGLKDEKARILFAGMRIGDLVSRTRGILRDSRRGPSVRQNIEACFAQFDVIGLERDRLVHRDLFPEPGVGIRLSNEKTAKSAMIVEEHVFNIENLNQLQLDCLSITIRLYRIIYPGSVKLSSMVRKVAYGPWRYKPSPPKTRMSPQTRRLVEALQSRPRSSPP
jgi:hypothetical protein